MHIQDSIPWTHLNDETLSFYRSIGVDLIQVDLRSGVSTVEAAVDLRDGRDSTPLFARMREQVERHEMQLNAVAMSCWEEITLDRPDRDEKMAAWQQMMRCMGQAGIPYLAWNFKPMGNFRTTSDVGRGGVHYSTFDYAEFQANRPPQHEPAISESHMWQRLQRFLQAVIPVAEAAGVTMALHPDDPPVPEALGGVAQVCSTPDHFRRIFAAPPSPNHRMLFCQGCMTEALGLGVYDFIAEMAGAGKIAYVHFRNVRGQLPRFAEVFIDEGEIDMGRAMRTYRDNGFSGPYMMDHTPRFPHTHSEWLGKAYAVGYIRALLQEVYG